jgi:hypothetical protein
MQAVSLVVVELSLFEGLDVQQEALDELGGEEVLILVLGSMGLCSSDYSAHYYHSRFAGSSKSA